MSNLAIALLRRRGLLPTVLLVGSFVLYAATAIRTPGWLDDTLILHLARTATIGTWVNLHNLFNLLGHLWIGALAFLDPHAALVLFCAATASLAVLFAYHAARELTANPLAAALAAAALAVSHSLWWHATVVEVYSLNAAIIAAVLFLVARFFRRGSFPCLLTAFLLFGIGVFNHVLMGLYAPAYLALFIMVLAKPCCLGWRRGLLLVVATLVGCLPYLVVFAREVVGQLWRFAPSPSIGSTLRGFVRALAAVLDGASGSFFRSAMFPRGLPGSERLFWRLNYLFLLWYNFPGAALPLAAGGAVALLRAAIRPASRTPVRPGIPRPVVVFFFIGALAQAVWSSNYLIWDMYAFSLPVYVMASLPLAAGIEALLRSGGRWLKRIALPTLLIPVALYPGVTGIAVLTPLMRWYASHYETASWTGDVFDPVRYVLNPSKAGYHAVEDFCLGVLERLPADAHYWDDDAKGDYPLRYYYLPIRGLRPDVTLHSMFSLRVDPRAEAETMQGLLEAGAAVFVSSLAYPEREVLAALAEQLPAAEVEEVPLGTRPGLAIYRVRLRPSWMQS